MDQTLFALLRGFFALCPASSLIFPSHLSPATINDFLINDILFRTHFAQYPPSRQYQQTFWKWIIANLEECCQKYAGNELCDEDYEIDSSVYDHYLGLISDPVPTIGTSDASIRTQICARGIPLSTPPGPSYITHFWSPFPKDTSTDGKKESLVSVVDPKSYHTVTLLESRTMIENGTTGLRTWLASFVLSSYLILHPELVNFKSVLELGSGVGFVGTIVASLQHLHWRSQNDKTNTSSVTTLGSVWLTDVNEEVLHRCRVNLALPCNLSSRHSNTKTLTLDWNDSLHSLGRTSQKRLIHSQIDPDIILGADILFDPMSIPGLVETLRICLHKGTPTNPKVALIALTVRRESTIESFLRQSLEKGIQIVDKTLCSEDLPILAGPTTREDSMTSVKLFELTLA